MNIPALQLVLIGKAIVMMTNYALSLFCIL